MSVSLRLLKFSGKSTKNIEITEDLFVETPNKQAMFDCVVCENAAQRQGTHSTLTKGEVRGGGKKPWRQKHTGRARTGSIRNPQWRGGGIVFGPKPNRNYTIKVNSKVRILGFKSALTLKMTNSNLYALDKETSLEKPSTKAVCEFIKKENLENQKLLIITNTDSFNLIKSTHNLAKVEAKQWNQVSVKDIMNANIVIAFEDTFAEYANQFNKKMNSDVK